MKVDLNIIESKFKLIESWNLTHRQKNLIYYPKDEKELKTILKYIKKNKKNFFIKSGSCSYDGKSIGIKKSNIAISLKNLNKLIEINKKNNIVNVQAGAKIADILFELKKNNFSMFAIPGGEHITIGGAIAANVIGKDSSQNFGAFGDTIKSLNVMFHDGSIKNLEENSKNFKLFIGSFGFFGIILNAKIKIRKIKSQNLLLSSNKINNYSDIQKLLNKNFAYKYAQLDPFLRKKNLGIIFYANFIKSKENIYNAQNFKVYFFEIFFFKIASIFLTKISWKIFNKFFIFLNDKKTRKIDMHNFFFTSKYKHLVPYLCRNGLIDYEILVKKNLTKIIKKIKELLENNNLYPIYFIIKKLYKSKRNYFYNFNNNGYAIAIAFDHKSLDIEKKEAINDFLQKHNLEINICKTDSLLINKFDKKILKKIKMSSNNSFMSVFKFKLINYIK